jgi:transketolase
MHLFEPIIRMLPCFCFLCNFATWFLKRYFMNNTPKIDTLKAVAMQLRRDVIRMVHAAESGHPGGSLGCADCMAALFFDVMQADPQSFTQEGHNEDLFFLSNGHISPVLYAALARRGYFEPSELATFRRLHTRLQGHPSNACRLPGVRVASGSLGQGVSIALGAALAKKMNHDPKTVFVLTGDGELEEGQIWEGLMYAGAKSVDNILLMVDYNGRQIDGTVAQVMDLGDLSQKFEAFGWATVEGNGNDMDELLRCLRQAKQMLGKGQPVAFLMRTEMGFGVDFMMGTSKWHGTPPNDEQCRMALAQLPETIGDY